MARPSGLRGRGLMNVWAQAQLMDNFLAPFRVFWVDPANGSDSREGTTTDEALATLAEAHRRMTAGLNDICMLVGDGSTTGTARVTSTLVWSKNACHIIGVGPQTLNSRARIGVLSGTTAYANFVQVTASGCLFKNFSMFNDNAIAAQITWADSGGRNRYEGVWFGGMGDQTSADSSTSRVLKLSGTGEHTFKDCIIGLDTIQRGAANASVEFVGGSKRNRFIDCEFNMTCDATTPLFILSSGVNPLETFQLFRRCIFHNPYPQSSASLLAAVATLPANGNGRLIMDYCSRYGVTDWGTDATSLAQIFVNGPAVGATDDVGRGSVAIAS